MPSAREPYPCDVSDEEWALIAPYLVLLREDAGQRLYSLRELFNGLRSVIRHGIPWRAMPNDLPPWAAVYQQAQRWLAAGVFEALADDLRGLRRLAAGRNAEPSAASLRRPRQCLEPSTAGPSAPHLRAASGRGMMAPSARGARSSTWRW